jgi:hypothetical protein
MLQHAVLRCNMWRRVATDAVAHRFDFLQVNSATPKPSTTRFFVAGVEVRPPPSKSPVPARMPEYMLARAYTRARARARLDDPAGSDERTVARWGTQGTDRL